MLINTIITATAGAVTGAAAGASFVWWRTRPGGGASIPEEHCGFVEDSLESQIDDAAARWAAASGRPEAAPLAANKLRLGLTLNGHPQSRRWHQ